MAPTSEQRVLRQVEQRASTSEKIASYCDPRSAEKARFAVLDSLKRRWRTFIIRDVTLPTSRSSYWFRFWTLDESSVTQRFQVYRALSTLWLAVLTPLVVLHGVGGHEVALSSEHVTSMVAARDDQPNKLFVAGVRCAINTADGKRVTVIESCAKVRELFDRAQR